MAGTELLRRTGRIARMEDMYVVLPDGTVRLPIDDQDWQFWRMIDHLLELRRVALTETPNGRVSTVILTMDHDPGDSWDWTKVKWTNLMDGPEEVPERPVGYLPLIYETMVFGGRLNDEKRRYRTREEALEGHRAMVERVMKLRPPRTRRRAKKKPS